mmetsp:Transcript_73140/g.202847  ORF Transcript_73140/g.202847 Transcript_73140/m.202847 type:complete len:283 (+) Transcript_73140:106-954(+)
MACFQGCFAGIAKSKTVEEITDRRELVIFLKRACASKKSREYQQLYAFLLRVFRVADRDFDGLVGPADFDLMVEMAGSIPRKVGFAPSSPEMFGCPAERIAKREELFKKIDTDGSGTISFHEFLGYTYDHICKMTASLDLTKLAERHDTKEHFKNFVVEACRSRKNPEYKELYELLLNTFVQADKDGDGLVNVHEFDRMVEIAGAAPRKFGFAPSTKKMFKSVEERVAARTKMFKSMDEDNSGTISFEEWLNFTYKHICEKAKMLDNTLTGVPPPVHSGRSR